MKSREENVVLRKSYEFALSVVEFCRVMQRDKEFVLSRQLLRSGTSIGANVEEAQAAQSRADFVSKMSIASKEARETLYWLRLVHDSGLAGRKDAGLMKARCEELVQILTAIVKTGRSAPRIQH